ncbi:MAG: RluA family pseudouridine synthase [Hymenobacteraceae bacterium]|nr:RluA family pseudouridine synthase [Hymenobacteraceae bacterium]
MLTDDDLPTDEIPIEDGDSPDSYLDEDAETDADSDDLIREVRLVGDRGQALVRLDKFLFDRIAKASRNRLQNAIRAGSVTVNGKPTKAAYRVRPLDVVVLALPAEQREVTTIEPQQMDLDIRYEDATVLLVNKPPGIVVHPAHGNWRGTLVNGLAWHLADLPVGRSGEVRPGLVHRIDKDTSGLLIVGKTDWAMTHLSNQFFHHTIERTYYALVWGVPKAATGTIRGHIGRHPRERKLMTVYPDGDHGKHAVTHYEVVRSFGHAALVKCQLETGRTHQIRAHFKYIGHPLFGDVAYGGAVLLQGPRTARYRQFVANTLAILPRQALHAASLGFEHPDTGQRLYFETAMPEDLVEAIARWERYAAAVEGGREGEE